jgi:hypothetical protein
MIQHSVVVRPECQVHYSRKPKLPIGHDAVDADAQVGSTYSIKQKEKKKQEKALANAVVKEEKEKVQKRKKPAKKKAKKKKSEKKKGNVQADEPAQVLEPVPFTVSVGDMVVVSSSYPGVSDGHEPGLDVCEVRNVVAGSDKVCSHLFIVTIDVCGASLHLICVLRLKYWRT